jgi:hypothetical protein
VRSQNIYAYGICTAKPSRKDLSDLALLLAAMWLWGGEAQRRLAVRACLVAMLSVGINQLIGLVWQQ